jgi:hypothetical protein
MAMFDRTALGFFVPESQFKPEDIPDLSGKVAIVTGGNVSCESAHPSGELISHRLGSVNSPLNIFWNTMPKYTWLVDLRRKQQRRSRISNR